MQIHIHRDGKDFGPYTVDEVNRYLGDGSVVPTDMAWHDGLPDWIPVTQIKGVSLAAGKSLAAGGGVGKGKLLVMIGGAAVAAAVLAGGIVFLVINKGKGGGGGGGGEAGGVSFAKDIKPILQAKCWKCHGDDAKKGGYSLNARDTAITAIKAGDPDASDLFKRIKRADEDDAMPPKADDALSKAEVDLIGKWIKEGAKWN